MRILIIDNDKYMRLLFSQMLQHCGFEIDTATDGPGGLQMWERGGYHAVITDVEMPGLNGLELTSAIRKAEEARGGRTPIIIVTAHAHEEDCRGAGADGYLRKPFRLRQCVDLIQMMAIPPSPTGGQTFPALRQAGAGRADNV